MFKGEQLYNLYRAHVHGVGLIPYALTEDDIRDKWEEFTAALNHEVDHNKPLPKQSQTPKSDSAKLYPLRAPNRAKPDLSVVKRRELISGEVHFLDFSKKEGSE